MPRKSGDFVKVEYIENGLSDRQKQEVWEILCQCDKEFIPPLSARNSTSQNQLLAGTGKDSAPHAYFAEMIKQNFILTVVDNRVVGFMTFKKAYSCPELESFGESLYVTTVCIKHNLRGKGLLTKMYGEIEHNVTRKLGCFRISTRTWSKNHAQIHVLMKLGYRQVAIIKNDRGEGIDTIYFGKHVDLDD